MKPYSPESLSHALRNEAHAIILGINLCRLHLAEGDTTELRDLLDQLEATANEIESLGIQAAGRLETASPFKSS